MARDFPLFFFWLYISPVLHCVKLINLINPVGPVVLVCLKQSHRKVTIEIWYLHVLALLFDTLTYVRQAQYNIRQRQTQMHRSSDKQLETERRCIYMHIHTCIYIHVYRSSHCICLRYLPWDWVYIVISRFIFPSTHILYMHAHVYRWIYMYLYIYTYVDRCAFQLDYKRNFDDMVMLSSGFSLFKSFGFSIL